jgi:hypothetical protein
VYNNNSTTAVVATKNIETLNGMEILIESQKKMENNMFFMSQQILNLQLQKVAQPLPSATTVETAALQTAQTTSLSNQQSPTPTTITNNNNNNSAVATVDLNSLTNLLCNNNTASHNAASSAYHHHQYHQQQQVFSQPSFYNSPYYLPPFPYPPAVKPDNTAFLSFLAHLSSK